MSDVLFMVWAFLTGLALGALFFGGLWFTVKKLAASRIPAVLVFSSFLFRISITSIGFYFVGSGNWQRLLICMLGFITSRFIIISVTRPAGEKRIPLKKEVNNED